MSQGNSLEFKWTAVSSHTMPTIASPCMHHTRACGGMQGMHRQQTHAEAAACIRAGRMQLADAASLSPWAQGLAAGGGPGVSMDWLAGFLPAATLKLNLSAFRAPLSPHVNASSSCQYPAPARLRRSHSHSSSVLTFTRGVQAGSNGTLLKNRGYDMCRYHLRRRGQGTAARQAGYGCSIPTASQGFSTPKGTISHCPLQSDGDTVAVCTQGTHHGASQPQQHTGATLALGHSRLARGPWPEAAAAFCVVTRLHSRQAPQPIEVAGCGTAGEGRPWLGLIAGRPGVEKHHRYNILQHCMCTALAPLCLFLFLAVSGGEAGQGLAGRRCASGSAAHRPRRLRRLGRCASRIRSEAAPAGAVPW